MLNFTSPFFANAGIAPMYALSLEQNAVCSENKAGSSYPFIQIASTTQFRALLLKICTKNIIWPCFRGPLSPNTLSHTKALSGMRQYF